MKYQTLETLYDDYLYAGGCQSLAECAWCAGELNVNPKVYLIYLARLLEDQLTMGEL